MAGPCGLEPQTSSVSNVQLSNIFNNLQVDRALLSTWKYV
jgi:hypothetical protein